MHVLVTGCCGFIGSHLSEKLLAEGYQVTGIDNFDPFYNKEIKLRHLEILKQYPAFNFFETDLRQAGFSDVLSNQNFDAVIHLAAKVGVQPSVNAAQEYLDANISATTHLLDFIARQGIKKMLFASSSSVYGNNNSVPFTETDEVSKPISPYAATKRACELLNYTYHHLYQIDIINLRLFTVYGPRQRPDLAIHKFVKKISAQQPIQLYGNGSTARDYTFVADIVAGFSAALQYLLANKNVFETVNLGGSSPVQLKELVQIIADETKTEPVIEWLPLQPGDVNATYANTTKAEKLFGYKPATDIRTGMAQFVKWYREQNF